jgi:hypothetical protein
MQLFVEQQNQFQDAMATNPLTAISQLASQNFKLWQEMQDDFLKAAGLKTDDNSK